MIRGKIITQRYGDAFLSYARGSLGLEKILEELKELKTIIRDTPEFKEFFKNKGISNTEKYEFIDRALDKALSSETRNFMKLLLKNGRIEFISDIVDYLIIKHSHGEAVNALIKTTFPLNDELVEAIRDKLENKLKKKLNLYLDVDGDLLGGAEVIIGNIIIDGSVRRRLEDLKKKMMGIEAGVAYGHKTRRDYVNNKK